MAGTRSIYFTDEAEAVIKLFLAQQTHVQKFSRAVCIHIVNSNKYREKAAEYDIVHKAYEAVQKDLWKANDQITELKKEIQKLDLEKYT